MQITFDLSHLANNPRERDKVEHILRAALARINQVTHRQGRPFTRSNYRSGAALDCVPHFTFNLDTVFHPGASKVAESEVLMILLNTLIFINLVYLRFHPRTPTLYRSGVYYDRTEIWDPIPALYKRGYGDCKSLSCALVAQFVNHGIEARAVHRWAAKESGFKNYHILVMTNHGFEDPSRKLGMGANENAYFRR